MVRRFARDLSEGRKPPRVLARRGWALMRAEPEVVAHAEALGARPVSQSMLARTLEAGASTADPPDQRVKCAFAMFPGPGIERLIMRVESPQFAKEGRV